MLQLALLAALLMAFAPSVTRWVASAGTQVLAGWTELCTTEGIQWVDTRAESPVGKSPLPDGMPMGPDCAYCTLAAALPLLVLAIQAVATGTLSTRISNGMSAIWYHPGFFQYIRGWLRGVR